MKNLRIAALAVALSLGFAGYLCAKAVKVPLPQKCKESDFIAIVEIGDTVKGGASERYLSVATVKVVEAIKGRVDGNTFKIDYDNGLACPNVVYTKGERCLVFLRKLPTGHFETYNFDFGKYIVAEQKIDRWDEGKGSKLDEVVLEIKRHLKE